MKNRTNLFCPVCGEQSVIEVDNAEVKYGGQYPHYNHEFVGRYYLCTKCNEAFVKELD